MAQQTAVEWLIEKIQSYQIEIDMYNRINIDVPKYMIEQAKEMEKDQICEAWQHSKQQTFLGLGKVLTSEEYYNETYKKSK